MIRGNIPHRHEPEDTRFWCHEHECYMIQDMGGNIICILCLMEDRLEWE